MWVPHYWQKAAKLKHSTRLEQKMKVAWLNPNHFQGIEILCYHHSMLVLILVRGNVHYQE